MKSSIVQFLEIDKHKNFLGNKTLNLKNSVDFGFNVPKFIAISSKASATLFADESERENVASEIIGILPSEKYAVRSSALIEDSKDSSLAGQFLTKTNVDGKDLSGAIYEVLKQAEGYLDDKLNEFSIIVQEYIMPDMSGVVFTRNPNGNREMIIEYGFCEGEKIVSGEIKPKKVSFYHNEPLPKNLPKIFLENQIVEKFKAVEKKNNFPQDIEWCIRGDQFYLLQTRPITTISDDQYKQIVFLEGSLPKKEKYFFEKTEISEIAPRPSAITFSMLQYIYTDDGPVDRVYRKYGVKYQDTDFLKIIGNELYVDKEKEIGGLLSGYTYFNDENFSPKMGNPLKALPLVKNLFFINKIKTSGYKKLFDILKLKIENGHDELDLKTAMEKFLTEYEIIFEINLLSGLSVKKLNLLLKNEPINFADIIDGHSLFTDLREYDIKNINGLTGNSLEISDTTDFITDHNSDNGENKALKDWWQKIPEYKKNVLNKKIEEAIVYNHLRELGRWLTVKNVNILRELLFEHAKTNGFKDIKNIYFADLGSLLRGVVDEKDCRNSRYDYEKYGNFNLPNSLTSSVLDRKGEILGVSSGVASGVLLTKEEIEKKHTKGDKIILYTEILSPDLTVYFDRISGIVSNNGGLLSHLAIVAREKNIPAVVGFSISDSKVKIGDSVQIDGSRGKIVRIDKI